MQFYFAPLEGITGYVYRNAFRVHFDRIHKDTCGGSGIDKYYAPFISPGHNKKLSAKEKRDVLPENNQGIYLVPQVLTNDADSFVRTAVHLQGLGYTEVNLNLGCPSGTVVAKNKGAGLLQDIRLLDAFLDKVYAGSPIAVSIKTRIGMEDVSEWQSLLKVYNGYPVSELIVHPRLRQDQYRGQVHMEQFAYTMEHARMPVCYNGDIFNVSDYHAVEKRFPALKCVMLGRGLLTNPALIRQLLTGQALLRNEFGEFHNDVFHAYEREMSGERNLLFKMKELWNYWVYLFDDLEHNRRRIRKVQSKQEYVMTVSKIINHCKMVNQGYRSL